MKPSIACLFCCVFFTSTLLSLSETASALGLWFIFCQECTSLENDPPSNISDYKLALPRFFTVTQENQKLLRVILYFERGLNVDDLGKSNIIPKIVGHGATSVGFRIPGFEHLLIRRLPGFSSYKRAIEHINLINEYRSKLHQLSIHTTKTQLIALENSHGYGVVYVVQPFLRYQQLSKSAFKQYGDEFKKKLLKKQADIAKIIIRHNMMHPESAITVDIVNNNWEIFNLNPQTMEFDIRLNDIAQPLFKENYQLTYDFEDQAFSILTPLDWFFVQPEMKKEFGELFEPRNLLMQALWGYDELHPDPGERVYPDWAMETVNDVLRSLSYATITGEEALTAHQQDKNAIACMDLYREASHHFRQMFGLNSNIYMTPDKSTKEMYFNKTPPSYTACFVNALKGAISDLIYGPPQHVREHQVSPK